MSETPGPVVILLNRNFAHNCVGKLTGRSGVEYGYSSYEDAFQAHVCRMSLEDWRKNKQDITLGFDAFRGWWEVDFELPDAPVGGEDVRSLISEATSERLDAIVSSLAPIVQAVYERVKQLRPAPAVAAPASTFTESKSPQAPHVPAVPGQHTPESLSEVVNYKQLLKLAKSAGVKDPEQFDSTVALRRAILANQGSSPVTAEYASPRVKRMFDIQDPAPTRERAFQGGCAK